MTNHTELDDILNKLIADRYFPVSTTGVKLKLRAEAKAAILANYISRKEVEEAIKEFVVMEDEQGKLYARLGL